ncbi:MAG TPA: hypothetical protein PKO06_23665, partial [Candidatus Ozemobacteraceae bacterium]|nr:hypothetical protein [Candidatus Ozemobacteraceae bacterium]
LEWGAANGIHEAVMAYIGNEGIDVLYDNNGDFAFPTPRSWEMASKVFSQGIDEEKKRLMAACIGPSAADKFFTFQKIYGQVDVEAIVNKGLVMDFSKGRKNEPSFVYAATFAVAAYASNLPTLQPAQASNVVKFLRSPGLDPEYVFLFLRQIKHRGKNFDCLKPVPDFQALAGSLVDIRSKMYK